VAFDKFRIKRKLLNQWKI